LSKRKNGNRAYTKEKRHRKQQENGIGGLWRGAEGGSLRGGGRRGGQRMGL